MAVYLPSREQAMSEVEMAAAEVVSFDDFGREVAPPLERLLRSAGFNMYRSEVENAMVRLAGNDLAETVPEYLAEHAPEDPLQLALRRSNPWIFPFSRAPEWPAYQGSSAYRYFARAGYRDFLHIRLLEGGHYEAGMVGLVLGRSPSQDAFSEDDCMFVARLLPSLRAAARRCARSHEAARSRGVIEAMLDEGERPALALDVHGRLLWMSPRASRQLGDVPAAVIEAARRLGAALRGGARLPAGQATVAVRGTGGTPLDAALRVAREQNGAPFILVELLSTDGAPALESLAARHELTRAESQVLAHLAIGLRDREIARRMSISEHTVRSHVGHILGKLGVGSRLEAALVSRGVRLST